MSSLPSLPLLLAGATYDLANPWVLLLLGLVPLVWWAALRKRGTPAVRFPDAARLGAASSRSRRLAYVLPLLRSLALIVLIICVARPRKADEKTRVRTEGVAIQLVVDRSGSMDREDFQDAQGRLDKRIEVVKDVVQAFIKGDEGALPGRPDDLIGLIAFGTFADTLVPPTRDHDFLVHEVEALEALQDPNEGETAIGDALLLAVERMRDIGRRFAEGDDFQIKSRVIVLLTDGEQTTGRYDPVEAAEAAATLGIKVYTVGAVPEFELIERPSLFGGTRRIRQRPNIDATALQKVAELTGGKYFRAREQASLREIYSEIDRLERSAVDETQYFVYNELAYAWIEAGGVRLPPPLLIALGLIALEVLLANTRLRRIP